MSSAILSPVEMPVQRVPSAARAPAGLKNFLPPKTTERLWGDLITESTRDRQFVAMLRGFRESGGLLRGDEVAVQMQRTSGYDVSLLARWIVTSQVLSFEWRSELWLPMFQFEPKDMSRREAARRVMAELQPAFDAWNLSSWFSQPNSWLNDRAPADLLSTELPAVLQAARADRFVAMG